jgi:[ribosomal protein S5]-alanine N-acetyltransferase
MLGLKRLDFGLMAQPRADLTLHAASPFGGLRMRPPHMLDYSQWSQLRANSRRFLQPWEPIWPTDDLTRSAFRRRITRYNRDITRDEGYPFFIFSTSDDQLLGGLNLTNIRRGAASMAVLGYWMGEAYAGKGIMSAAVQAIAPMAHKVLGIRRIEAACLPSNAASVRLLEKAGFVQEGLGKDYLLINGEWCDHLLFARIQQVGTAKLNV